jgi:hypothetical protein
MASISGWTEIMTIAVNSTKKDEAPK